MKKILVVFLGLAGLLFIVGMGLIIITPLSDQENRKIIFAIIFDSIAIFSFVYAGLLINEYRAGRINNGWPVFIFHYPFYVALGIGLIFLASAPESAHQLLNGKCF